MKADKIVVSGLVATSLMTIFSYCTSKLKDKNFREPQLLGALLEEVLPNSEKRWAIPSGWVTHYGIGFVWALFHNYLFETFRVETNLKNSLFLGGLSGLVGAGVWKLVFAVHPNPPQISFKKFYGHLILAHMVYMAALAYAMRKDDRT